MFWYRQVLLALIAAVLLSSCEWQASHGPADLVPISCHGEPLVGMLFITIENHGNDAGPSMTTVEFDTNSPKMLQVRLEVKTPSIPSKADRIIAVDLPFVPAATERIKLVGKFTVTADSGKVLPAIDRKHNILVTNCSDII